MANFGNAQASALDAILKGVFGAFGNFIGGIFGSGIVSAGSNAVHSSNNNGQTAATYVVYIICTFREKTPIFNQFQYFSVATIMSVVALVSVAAVVNHHK